MEKLAADAAAETAAEAKVLLMNSFISVTTLNNHHMLVAKFLFSLNLHGREVIILFLIALLLYITGNSTCICNFMISQNFLWSKILSFSFLQARAGGGLGGIGGGSKKKVEEKKEVVVQLGLKTPEKPIHTRGFRRKEKHTHKVVLSAMEVQKQQIYTALKSQFSHKNSGIWKKGQHNNYTPFFFWFACLQEAEKAATNIRLQFEKVKLQEKMNEITTSFDDELELIRMEKFSLQVNMKCADLKMLAFYQA